MQASAVNARVQDSLQALHAQRHEQAAESARRALAVQPNHPLALLILGVAQHHLGGAEALDTLQRAVALAPHDPQFRYNYAVTLADCDQPELAMVEYRACLDCNPDFANALWNYGEMLRLREHFQAALDCFERLRKLEHTLRPKMAHRMAVCCAHLPGQEAHADKLFRAQLAEDDDAQTHWEYALYLLGRGRYQDAWPHYARRFAAGDTIAVHRARFTYPEWRGQFERGSTLLIHGEQGAGDEMLFAAFLPEVIRRCAASGMAITLACRPALQRLFAASFPQLRVQAFDPDQPGTVQRTLAEPVQVVAIGDLPLYIEKPAPAAYLRPCPEDVVHMRKVVASTHTPAATRRIGVALQANPAVTTANRVARNIPPRLLNELAAAMPGLRWFSLHPAEHRASLAHLADLDVVDLSAELTDFSRTAALMREMDGVVSVDTSTANLAGALGLDTRVLVQQHIDWRWARDCAWYPRVTTYRQSVSTDWLAPLRSLLGDLAASAPADGAPRG